MHVIPDTAVRYILNAGPSEARVAANRLVGSSGENPSLCILVNAVGVRAVLDIFVHAIETAKTEEDRAAWKALTLQITSAIQGAITS